MWVFDIEWCVVLGIVRCVVLGIVSCDSESIVFLFLSAQYPTQIYICILNHCFLFFYVN